MVSKVPRCAETFLFDIWHQCGLEKDHTGSHVATLDGHTAFYWSDFIAVVPVVPCPSRYGEWQCELADGHEGWHGYTSLEGAVASWTDIKGRQIVSTNGK